MLRRKKSIKLINERDLSVFRIHEIQVEAATKSFGRNYTTLGATSKDILMRKTYGLDTKDLFED